MWKVTGVRFPSSSLPLLTMSAQQRHFIAETDLSIEFLPVERFKVFLIGTQPFLTFKQIKSVSQNLQVDLWILIFDMFLSCSWRKNVIPLFFKKTNRFRMLWQKLAMSLTKISLPRRHLVACTLKRYPESGVKTNFIHLIFNMFVAWRFSWNRGWKLKIKAHRQCLCRLCFVWMIVS